MTSSEIIQLIMRYDKEYDHYSGYRTVLNYSTTTIKSIVSDVNFAKMIPQTFFVKDGTMKAQAHKTQQKI